MKKNGISRREFLKGSAAGAVSLAALGLLSACGESAEKQPAATPTAKPGIRIGKLAGPAAADSGRRH